MDIIADIFMVIIMIGILGIGLLMSFQEIHLNKERHDKEIEKIDTEIILLKEQISHNKKITIAKLEEIENRKK